MRLGKLKNGKAAGKNEITGETGKGGGDRVVDWIWKLCNMAFESSDVMSIESTISRSVVPEDWKSVVIVPLYKGKGEGTECKNYRGISLLSVVGKLYAEVLVDKIHKVTVSLIDDEQRDLKRGGVV